MAKDKNEKKPGKAEDDLKEKEVKAEEKACHLAMAIFLTVMKDKMGASNDEIVNAWNEWDKLSEEIKEGRVKLKDLTDVLAEEYDIKLVV